MLDVNIAQYLEKNKSSLGVLRLPVEDLYAYIKPYLAILDDETIIDKIAKLFCLYGIRRKTFLCKEYDLRTLVEEIESLVETSTGYSWNELLASNSIFDFDCMDFIDAIMPEFHFIIEGLTVNYWGLYHLELDDIRRSLIIQYVGDYRIIKWSESEDAKRFNVLEELKVQHIR